MEMKKKVENLVSLEKNIALGSIKLNYFIDKPKNLKANENEKRNLIVILPGFGDDGKVHAELIYKYLKSDIKNNFDFFRVYWQLPFNTHIIAKTLDNYVSENNYKNVIIVSYSIGGPVAQDIVNNTTFSNISKIKHIFYMAPALEKSVISRRFWFFVKYPRFFIIMSRIFNKSLKNSLNLNWQITAREILKKVRENNFVIDRLVKSTVIAYDKDIVCKATFVKGVFERESAGHFEIKVLKSTRKFGKMGHAPKSWNENFEYVAKRIDEIIE